MDHHPRRSSRQFANSWRGRHLLHLSLLSLSLLAGVAEAELTASRHWALFNTVCARCHEAQCSGRMSLGQNDAQARAHVERYAGSLTEDVHQQLVRYLQHMKEVCGFAAIPLAFEPQAVWSEAQLEFFHTPGGEAYFMPLGELGAGDYRLQARLVGTDWIAQVVSADFDVVGETASCDKGDEFGLEFQADAGMYYLRLMGRSSLELKTLRLLRIPAVH